MGKLTAMFAVICLLGGCQSNDTSSDPPAPNGQAAAAPSLSTQDQDFIQKAAIGGMFEVQAAQIAEAKANRPDVKQFAEKMIADHTRVNTELQQLAAQKGVTVPAQLNSEHQRKIDELNKLNGADFEKHYVDGQVQAHDKTIDLFQKESSDGQDGDLKAFASRTLPTLQKHLDMIKGIQSSLSQTQMQAGPTHGGM